MRPPHRTASVVQRHSVVRVLALVLLLAHSWPTEACNGGFEMVVHKIENCAGEKQIISIDPSTTVALTKDCDVIPKGTVRTKGFQTAQMQVTITKNGLPVLKESVDLCASMQDAANHQEAVEVLTMFGVPKQCPVKEGEVVNDGTKRYSLDKYKHHLLMAQGRSIIDVVIQHDNGQSCFKIDSEVKNSNVLG